MFPTVNASISQACFASSLGDFGDTSNVKNGQYVDFKYELVVASSVALNADGSVQSLVHEVEIAVTNLLLATLFSGCSSTIFASRQRSQIRMYRYLGSNAVVVGLSALPSDFISFGKKRS